MNRRTAIRKALGIGAVVVAAPVVNELAVMSSDDRSQYNLHATISPVECTPPPPDTRTPEQVIADQDAEFLKEMTQCLTREPDPWSRRYAYTVRHEDFDPLVAHLTAAGIPFEQRLVNGRDALIGANGNIVRKDVQRLYI